MSVSVRSLLVQGPQAKGPATPFTYASTPRALYNNAKLRRDPSCGSVGRFANVMHERRVVRGSTFAAHPMAHGDGLESAAARNRQRLLMRKRAARARPGTPPPAPGRAHRPLQTDHYLEELFDKGEEMSVGVQTDLWADRPATPLYRPAKTGADASTQIQPGDLFDFELEVLPVLEALVGKTCEQALGEAAQEEELEALRERQRRWRELRDGERAERERLQRQDRRLLSEKERRKAEAELAAARACEARERAAAATLVSGHVAALLPSVLAGLRDQGALRAVVHAGTEEEFLPWLVQEVSQEIESVITSREVISEIVREVVEARAELFALAGERRAERAAQPTPDGTPTPPTPASPVGEELDE